MTTVEQASAAASGASATERFHADKSPFEAVKDTPTERVDLLAREVLDAVHETIRKHKVSYDEYNALKAWLINVGQDGEWPLFLDVWVEHVVEDVATEHREGNKGSIEGPYYVPDAPELRCGRHHSDARRRGRHPAGVGGPDQLDRRNAVGGQDRTVARRLRRLLLAVRARPAAVEPARLVLHRSRRQLRDHHDAARRRTRSRPTDRAAS